MVNGDELTRSALATSLLRRTERRSLSKESIGNLHVRQPPTTSPSTTSTPISLRSVVTRFLFTTLACDCHLQRLTRLRKGFTSQSMVWNLQRGRATEVRLCSGRCSRPLQIPRRAERSGKPTARWQLTHRSSLGCWRTLSEVLSSSRATPTFLERLVDKPRSTCSSALWEANCGARRTSQREGFARRDLRFNAVGDRCHVWSA